MKNILKRALSFLLSAALLCALAAVPAGAAAGFSDVPNRSEERRVGKEC